MRTILIGACVGLGVGLSWLSAAGPLDNEPEARAYLGVEFGGANSVQPPLRYGLRIDHDRRYAHALSPNQPLPPMAQVEFSGLSGFKSASFNGVPFAQRGFRLDQNGDEVEWNFVDWGLLVAGVVGIGFVVAEVAKGDEDPDPTPVDDGGDTGGDTGGTPLGGIPLGGTPVGGTPVGGTPVGGTPGGTPVGGTPVGGTPVGLPGYAQYDRTLDAADRERQMWLDGGTGQMGDLHVQQ